VTAALLGFCALLGLGADEKERLVAQVIDGDAIRDIAGEGPPLVGVVERRGEALWLVVEGGGDALRLVGRLAHPRIAGPGYRVWVIGTAVDGGGYQPRRLGVLSPPR
jgi:hypothetical protein